MDELEVTSVKQKGTTVRLKRSFIAPDNEAYA